MIASVLIALFGAIGTYKFWQYMWHRPPNFPPGPPRLPLFGSYLLLLLLNYRHIHRAILRLCRYYDSPVIGFHHGPLPVVVCTDMQSVREALRNPALDGKQGIVLTDMRAPEHQTRGIFFTDGPVWRDNRRFTLRHLRDFGYGRRMASYELELQAEVQDMLQLIREGPRFEHEHQFAAADGVVLAPAIFYGVTGNAVMRAMFNESLAREESRVLYEAGDRAMHFAIKADAFGRMFSILPFLPALCPGWSGYGEMRRSALELYGCVERIVRTKWAEYEREVAVGGEGAERSWLEIYFKEMRSGGNKESFNMQQLLMNCTDLWLPTFSTLGSALSYMVQRWVAEPHVLRRIQAEIDETVGRSRLPNLDDRPSLPYTEAALREILRLRTPIPSGFPHRAMEETTVAGYTVPKGAFVVTGLQAGHWSEESFADAMLFRPERFLNDEGKLCVAKDVSLPFGAGKRLCAAETFSRNLMFLVVAALAQNFTVRTAEGREWSVDLDECRTGIISLPQDMWVQFAER